MAKKDPVIKELFSSRSESEKEKFEQDLISEVMERPLLYDKVNPNYMKTQLVTKAWTEIGKKIGFCPITDVNKIDIDARLCKEKWKNLKDYFLKVARKATEHSGDSQDMNVEVITWKWYTSMLFLKDVNHPQPTIDTLDISEDLLSLDSMASSPPSVSSAPATPGDQGSTSTTKGRQSSATPTSKGCQSTATTTALAYGTKRKKKQSEKVSSWGEMAEKVTKILDQKETIDQTFSNYICSEMERMNDQRKKAFKKEVFNLINKINDDDEYDY